MKGFNLNALCDVIILVSAIIIALKNIYNFIKKPVDGVSDFARRKEDEHINLLMEQKIPKMLEEHSNSVKEERSQETQQAFDELKSVITSSIDEKFDDLKDIVLSQGKEITEIKDTLEKVKNSSKDVLRIRMNEIYYKYLPYRKICDSDKQLFDSLYADYADLEGNSGWKKMNATVQTWTVVDDNFDFET